MKPQFNKSAVVVVSQDVSSYCDVIHSSPEVSAADTTDALRARGALISPAFTSQECMRWTQFTHPARVHIYVAGLVVIVPALQR